MMQCPDCRKMIPDDSAFCDQCGKELMWCSECKRPKRGTECPICGEDLVPGRRYLSVVFSSTVERIPEKPASDIHVQPVALVGNGWRLMLAEGQFGRIGGIWPELSNCQYVSGRHGNIASVSRGWTITDVGSTNGTYLNGTLLVKGVATPFKTGDTIRIATIDFKVE